LQTDFDDFFSSFLPSRIENETTEKTLSPKLNISESDDAITIEAELPGIDEKDVEVTLTDDGLSIIGARQGKKETKDDGVIYREISSGKYSRTIPLDILIEESKITAKMKNGVLSVVLPKTPEAKPKSHKITVNGK